MRLAEGSTDPNTVVGAEMVDDVAEEDVGDGTGAAVVVGVVLPGAGIPFGV